MLQISEIDRLLIQTYVADNVTNNPWIYEIAQVPIEVALEHGVRGSFLASLLALFTSSAYAAHLVFPKLIGFAKLGSYPILLRWVLAYLVLFYAYFSNVSLRYLVPLMVPLAIIITLGFQTIFQRIQDSQKQQGVLFLFLSLTLFFIVPIFPLRVLRDGYLSYFFYFHTSKCSNFASLVHEVFGFTHVSVSSSLSEHCSRPKF